jgi:S-DNA-T family DNA segregation ATPase FtsK/SpoIIIE
VGASDLADLRRRAPDGPPLPRLVVVVDEFAALRVAVPDFVDALVDVAQRGRSLGVHLILATQRPSGAVSPAIQANVGLRICLRVQSAQESTDVIASPDGADLPRRVPGRALVRLGPGELVAAQVGMVSAPEVDAAGVRVRPLGAPRPPTRIDGGERSRGTGHPGRSDLEAVVDVVAEAWTRSGGAPPRCPWPDPLPDLVPWPLTAASDPGTGSSTDRRSSNGRTDRLVLGLADDPDRQRRTPFAWDLARGPILALGLPGAGGATLAATAVLEAVRTAPEPPVVHVIDGGPGDLHALAGLASVGAVVTAHDHERQRRLLATVAGELAARQTDRGRSRTTRLVVVHGLAALRAHWEGRGDPEPWGDLLALLTGGAACGVHLCLTSEGAVPHQVLAACEQRVLFRLGDPGEAAVHGIPGRAVPPLPPDRAVTLTDGTVTLVHLARPPGGLAAAVAVLAAGPGTVHPAEGPAAGPEVRPEWIGVLPRSVTHQDLADHLADHLADTPPHPVGGGADGGPVADGGRVLLMGVADRHLGPARLHLPPGGHALVAGPPRSGRTTALARLAAEAATGGGVVWVVARGSAPPPLPPSVTVVGADDDALTGALDVAGPLVVLVDDADRTEDDHAGLAALVADRRPDRHVVAAGRNDHLRRRFGHWTREVRADGTGLLLVPDLDLDGDLLGTRLPRRPSVDLVCGRGWLTGPGGSPSDFVQVALPPPPDAPPVAPRGRASARPASG